VVLIVKAFDVGGYSSVDGIVAFDGRFTNLGAEFFLARLQELRLIFFIRAFFMPNGGCQRLGFSRDGSIGLLDHPSNRFAGASLLFFSREPAWIRARLVLGGALYVEKDFDRFLRVWIEDGFESFPVR